MTVARVPGDEHPPDPIFAGHGDAQVPEPDVIEISMERKAGSALNQTEKVIVFRRCFARHRSVEEEAFAHVNPTKELPVALQVWVKHSIRGPVGEAFHALVQLGRTEDRQHHTLVEIRTAAIDAQLLTYT